ncbi:hypothetical protein Cylst_1787 [Cylindrospermum stagnale PCC 7417]|uniref:Uncharacterized protein n=1 Tax=Cylindrospermum stagnale PCC 7417 TaxID=56107 RepID=K9WV11_9NOST|nr:hypothetical protein Cylst_1787 [Cylindrospermum stagnale PCC 7417]
MRFGIKGAIEPVSFIGIVVKTRLRHFGEQKALSGICDGAKRTL